MTTPFPFQSGATLLASQLNDITNLPINDQTASYTLVVGDAGKRVIMNVASANTVTVNNSIFTTGDTIFIANKGAGVSTITAGAGVTINTSDSLALAQHQSGLLVAQSASVFAFYPSTKTVNSGFAFISQQSISAATSFSLPNSTFTSTYRSYRVVIDGACSGDSAAVTMRLRASGSDLTTSNYFGGLTAVDTTATARLDGSNGTEFDLGTTLSVGFALSMDVYAPQVATTTRWTGTYVGRLTNTAGGAFGGIYNASTQADALSIILAGGQTFTGIVTTYGYANS